MFPGFTLTGGRTTYHKNKMHFWKFQAISRFFLDPNCGVATYLFFFTNHVVMTNYFAAIPHMLPRGYLFTNVVLMTNYFAAIPHVTPTGEYIAKKSNLWPPPKNYGPKAQKIF